MTGLEIKQQIDSNNDKMQRLVKPSTFILNKEVLNLIKENIKLQEQCHHEFEEGYCIFCYLEEKH